MRRTLIVSLGLLGLVGLFFAFRPKPPPNPAVTQAVAKLRATLPSPELASRSASPAPSSVSANSTRESAPSRTVTIAPPQVGIDAIAVSSFFASNEVSGLTNEQLARLELVLSKIRRATYELLVSQGRVTRSPNGSITIAMPAQGDALQPMRDYLYATIEGIVGPEQMKALQPALKARFEAKFGYYLRSGTRSTQRRRREALHYNAHGPHRVGFRRPRFGSHSRHTCAAARPFRGRVFLLGRTAKVD